MGCDIHFHVEVKINGKWEHYSHPSIQRYYYLFAKLAGVRNSEGIKPVVEPKGLPSDMSNLTKIDADYWGLDRHSSSWLNAKEIAKVESWWNDLDNGSIESEVWGYLFGNPISGPEEGGAGYPREIEDVRIVFWFDN